MKPEQTITQGTEEIGIRESIPEIKYIDQRPVEVFRSGAYSACMFFNQITLDAKEVEKPGVSLAKLYMKRGLVKKTTSLRQENLPLVILVLGQAHEWLAEMEENTGEVMYGARNPAHKP